MNNRHIVLLAAAAALLVLAEAALAAPYVILRDGTRKEGTRIRADKDGTIQLLTAQGLVPYAKGTYQEAAADKPAEFDKLSAAVKVGKVDDSTIKALKDLVSSMRYLKWDVEGQKLLAEALLKKGDAAAADLAYKELYTFNPELQKDVEIGWGHRRAMLAAKQYASLQKSLDAVVAAGPRSEAARAQNMRGDIWLAQNKLEAAAMDYLRTAILFADVKDPAIQGEACFKAAQCLEKLRDSRYKDLYRKCATEYRSSTYAAQCQGKY